MLATASATDASLKNPLRAAQILESFYETNATHPGVVHNLIHAYDYPPVAARGLKAARATRRSRRGCRTRCTCRRTSFTRLGMWNDVIASNLASADAARQYASEPSSPGHVVRGAARARLPGLRLPAARRRTARRGTCSRGSGRCARPSRAADYRGRLRDRRGAARATRSRRRQWGEAIALVEPQGSVSLEKFTFGAAHFAFARCARRRARGPRAGSAQAMARLEQLRTGMTGPAPSSTIARQSLVQLQAVKGWLASAEGRPDEAAKLPARGGGLRRRARQAPVSPGSLLPAREILADFLLERGQVREALAEYEQCLKLNPGRLNSLYGAGSASSAHGERRLRAQALRTRLAAIGRPGRRPAPHRRSLTRRRSAYLAGHQAVPRPVERRKPGEANRP
jgi:tetratricopeptide (TPR) repeat protein